LLPRLFWGTYVKRTFISAAAILAFAATAHADELSDIQAQAKQMREQNAAMAKRLADTPPLAARFVKQRLFGSGLAELEHALDEEIRRQVECFMSKDCAEGLTAFFEKRRPEFRGE